MHDIDAHISKITGQNNYMETLQKITGNIMTVDLPTFRNVHKKISACDFNINVLLDRFTQSSPDNKSIKEIHDQYLAESTKLSIKDNTFVMYQRKCKNPKPPREIIAPGHSPSDLIKSDWFRHVKHIEKAITKYFTSVFPPSNKPEDNTFQYLSTVIYKSNPEVRELQTIYDIVIDSEQTFTQFIQLRKCSAMIINLLLVPMYDVKGTIRKHWNKIQKIFTSKAFQQTGIASPEDIIEMLYQFIVAKYRATITGNNKHYAKLFLSLVGNDNVTNLDGARFLEIMDNIDLDKLDKNENVYKFASNAKDIIHQIINNENINAKEIIEKLNKSFGVGDEEKSEPKVVETTDAEQKVDEPANDGEKEGEKYTDLL